MLRVHDLVKTFTSGRALLGKAERSVAVDHVSFEIEAGASFGLVGESGSGKSTTARIVARLLDADSGSVELKGVDLLAMRGRDLLRARREVQMVFQDPFASLNPRWKVGSLVAEGLRIHHRQSAESRRTRVLELLDMCGLPASAADRYPHEFSGGQRQRIGIARALAVEPEVLILDEPVSALDVSIQAQILTLLTRLRSELGLTYLFIAHDLAIVERFCDHVAVMQRGRIVEQGRPRELYQNPQDDYTKTLLSAIPIPDPRRRATPHPGGTAS
ncbi:ATP-binding cassette domain-containing protein [Ornithinimicrobium sufpigmenti]|uniref:ATP-binding cassette domain-containing protein n=1 Tax=Ornithinimicrobium sufpigmenti TaxID=2508882 RepID=UPI0011AE7CD4|nr:MULTISPECIES: ATP-binding cassette domain-containing protein [unclassified Ornithinimicrobium]